MTTRHHRPTARELIAAHRFETPIVREILPAEAREQDTAAETDEKEPVRSGA